LGRFGCKSTSLIFTLAITEALVVPVLAVTYNPGVTVGQFVKLGNYWGVGDPTFIESVTAMDWLRYDVTAVNGKNVTLASSGRLKNGTAVGGATATYNLEAGTMSTRYANDTPYTNGEIIAGNLSEGDVIPPPGYLKVNKTKPATYLGETRTVNIVNSTWSTPDVTINYGVVYDQITGLIVETQYESNQTQPTPRYIKYGASIIETNISGSTIPEFTTVPAIATTALLTLLAVLSRGRKRITHLETAEKGSEYEAQFS
jgi:hypothetical protein